MVTGGVCKAGVGRGAEQCIQFELSRSAIAASCADEGRKACLHNRRVRASEEQTCRERQCSAERDRAVMILAELYVKISAVKMLAELSQLG